MRPGQDNRPDSEAQSVRLPLSHRIRYALAGLRCRCTAAGRQARRLACWLEEEIFPAADSTQEESLTLIPRDDGAITVESVTADGVSGLCDCHDLCEFLRGCGIDRVQLDTRLESNQIEDVLRLLMAYRKRLTSPNAGRSGGPVLALLRSPDGLHFNCMELRIQGGVLVAQYSYCVTRLSMAVRWFERRHRRFADHRALFHAAPRYGLLAVALTGVVLGGFLLTGSVPFLIAATAVQAAILFAAVYVFMRGMGSVEYDNEESAYRLAQTHAKVTQYAQRIGHDLDLARTVQRKLLPDRQRMPLADRIEWASHFNPETEVGGDYFDAAALDEHRVAIVFADVSGHGMSAALITVIVKMAFQSWLETGWSLSEFVRCANRDLCRFTPTGSFVVLIAAIYDDKQRSLRYVNAGHAPEPFLLPADPSEPVRGLAEKGSMLLGIEEDIEINETGVSIKPGDAILLATDGLTEARNVRGELYGKDRLLSQLADHRAQPLKPLVSAVLDDMGRFAAGAEQTDDRTVLAFRPSPAGMPRDPETVETSNER